MRIKPTHIEALAKHIFKAMQSKNLVAFGKGGEETIAFIADIFRKNFEEEFKLNDEAKQLLEKNKAKIGLNIDEEKAFMMIKKQLAKERNFVL